MMSPWQEFLHNSTLMPLMIYIPMFSMFKLGLLWTSMFFKCIEYKYMLSRLRLFLRDRDSIMSHLMSTDISSLHPTIDNVFRCLISIGWPYRVFSPTYFNPVMSLRVRYKTFSIALVKKFIS